jgi:hypothetical protein
MRWVGEKGVWLLKIDKDGTVNAAYPGRFRQLTERNQIRRLLKSTKLNQFMAVDVRDDEQDSIECDSNQISVDITPYENYSVLRASIVLVLSIGLYWLLYKSHFRIR